MPFIASDLSFRDYSTDIIRSDTNPRTSGIPDETSFTRTEQAEVLYFINYCYQVWNWPDYTKGPGRKIEQLIRTYLPGGKWTQAEILLWIQENWKHYWNFLPGRNAEG